MKNRVCTLLEIKYGFSFRTDFPLNWKKALVRFKEHQLSECHKLAMQFQIRIPGKRGHIVANTLLPMMFLGLRKLGNIRCGHNFFFPKTFIYLFFFKLNTEAYTTWIT